MTTASAGVAVVATQLAQTDRRALSEAWYSALHLTRDEAPARARAVRVTAPAPGHAAAAHEPAPHGVAQRAGAATSARPQRAAGARGGPAHERRRPVTETVRRIERAVAALTVRPNLPAAQTVDLAGGRVRLLVRSDGRTTRIIAVCSRPLREQVERALAGARFALAAVP